ncbi:MAG: hypothetical protein FWC43_12355 [Planctomycetaceae bacterium]|nr:hypothetical protein [Planctomycetaceae bacterium]
MATMELIHQKYDLKARLIGRIGRVQNTSQLREVESLLDEKLPESVYVLSKDEREGMNIALQQLDAGLGISHETVEAELDNLLDELERECKANGN